MAVQYTAETCYGSTEMFDSIRSLAFSDGYCDCRCGPSHHEAVDDPLASLIAVYCRYHGRKCCTVRLPFVSSKTVVQMTDVLNRYATIKKQDGH
jgi:hypothetical protein